MRLYATDTPVHKRLSMAFIASFVVHGLLLAVFLVSTRTPSLGFEFQLPSEIEIGVLEATVAPPPETPSAAAPKATPKEAPTPVPNEGLAKESPKTHPAQDAGLEAAETPPIDTSQLPSPTLPLPASEQRSMVSSLVGSTGALLSLRMNVRVIRSSPLSKDVSELLAAVPDWNLILQGSGIQPLDDFEELLIASPNLKRASLVVLGQTRAGAQQIELAVKKQNEAHAQTAEWQTQGGLRTAPWPSDDETPRIASMVGEDYFILCRPLDLPRILAVAHAKNARKKKKTPTDAQPQTVLSALQRLLTSEATEVLRFDVENAKAFVRGRMQAIPDRAQLTLYTLGFTRARVVIEAEYPSAQDAAAALEYWGHARDVYANHTFALIAGFGPVLRNAKLEANETSLTFETTLNQSHLRFILRYLYGQLANVPPPQDPLPKP